MNIIIWDGENMAKIDIFRNYAHYPISKMDYHSCAVSIPLILPRILSKKDSFPPQGDAHEYVFHSRSPRACTSQYYP